MFRERPYVFRLFGLIFALVACIVLIWFLLNRPSELFRMLGV